MKKDRHLKMAVRLRRGGSTYAEIAKQLNGSVSKSTLSIWLRDIKLSKKQINRMENNRQNNLEKARAKALRANRVRRWRYLERIRYDNKATIKQAKNKNTKKLILVALYLGEGSKNTSGSLTFGNSNQAIIKIFLKLLRECYPIDEKKFRGTVQCRADHNTKNLERYWQEVTKIPATQFYKTRIDPRSIGVKSQKKDYNGVCRIDYFSAHIFNELTIVGQMLE